MVSVSHHSDVETNVTDFFNLQLHRQVQIFTVIYVKSRLKERYVNDSHS